jgi:NAD-dependent dihydropyrimidine dehydrogenase PreA subunit
LADLPKTSEAFANGDIGAGQAAEAGKALHACARPDASAEEARKERDALDEQVANTPCEVDRRRLREQLEQRAAQRSKDRLADKERRAHRKRHGRKFRDGDLLTVQFGGPGAAVQKIWEMVSALACRSDTTDERTQQQRNFDATVHLADRYLAEGALPEVNLQRPHVLLITSHDALHDLDGADPATLDGYGPVSINTARMICCDAELTVVVMSADGQPLRVGRTRYQPSRAQRRAVTARDRVCVGCGADATRCEVHHITFWEGGGPTNIENLVLVCWNCHTHIHHHGWVVTRDADGLRLSSPQRLRW